MKLIFCGSVMAGFLITCAVAFAQGQTPSQQTPPILSESLAGRDSFALYCAPCHGSGGRGDGPVTSALRARPADLTTLTQWNDGAFPRDRVRDFVTGLVKAGVFGALISSLACYLGLGVTGGAQGVGVATTRTVVLTIVALIAVDLLFTAVFYYLGW